MIPVQRINHAVLWVRDAPRVGAFYREAFDMEVVGEGPRAVFLRARGSENHHDLGLFSLGDDAPGPVPGAVGLYHLGWEVATLQDLVAARETLGRLGALVGENDHGTSKSLYAKDPDGNEFEVFWQVPRDSWDDGQTNEPGSLDIDAAIARFGSETITGAAAR
jgi:catechol-2,3-dioxygenase